MTQNIIQAFQIGQDVDQCDPNAESIQLALKKTNFILL